MPKLKHDIINDVVMDDEFLEIVENHKERELTDVEKDLKIQADKVVYVINRTIAKLTMMAYLPHFLEDDAAILREHIKPIEVYFIRDLLGKYGAEQYQASYCSLLDEYTCILENIPIKSQDKLVKSVSSSSLGESKEVIDPYVASMVDILFYNKCLKKIVREKDTKKVDRSLMKLIKALTEFKQMARLKLYVTGEDEAEMEKELRDAYNTNALMAASINELQEALEKQRQEMGEQLNKKICVFDMYTSKMDQVKTEFEEQMEKILTNSEEIMMEESAESEIKQEILTEDARKITVQYQQLLDEHLKQEKQSRLKRYKIETQLQNWLNKFDQDMGDRQAEYEALEKEYNDEKAAMDELQEKFDAQELEYVVLMKEKALEQERIDNELAITFLVNNSARKIQRWWRAYWERKMARRKARKGKKGKGKQKKPKKLPDTPAPDIPPPIDPNVLLLQEKKKFKGDVFEDLKDPNAFSTEVTADL